MNRLKEEFYKYGSEFHFDWDGQPDKLFDWINQNYISRKDCEKDVEVNCDMEEELRKIVLENQIEDILGLEGLKEEKMIMVSPDLENSIKDQVSTGRNQLRNEIKQQIIDYKNK